MDLRVCPRNAKEPRQLRICCLSTRISMKFHVAMRLRLIGMTGMHSSLLHLSVISTGSGLFQSRRSRNRQPAPQSWRKRWLVWRRNLRWYGWSSLRTTTSFAVAGTQLGHGTMTPSRFRRVSAVGRLPMMTRVLTLRSGQERAPVERISSATTSILLGDSQPTGK
jgi:hypothetical protein